MIPKITLTAAMLTLFSLTFAQDQSESIGAILGNKMPTVYHRNALQTSLPFIFSNPGKIEKNKPIPAKSASSYSSRLDSLVLDSMYKANYVYDNNGNTTLEVFSIWQYPNGWIPNSRMESVYDADDLPVERIESWWNIDEWTYSTRFLYVFDDQNNLYEKTFLEWNADEMDFEIDARDIHLYNGTGGLIERIKSYWNGNEWYESYKVSFVLDDENRILSGTGFMWLQAEEIWVPQTTIDYTYNTSGLEIEILHSTWSNGNLVPLIKVDKIYDDQNRMVSEEKFYSFGVENNWVEDNIKTYAYDEENNVIENINYTWQASSEQYIYQSKTINAFDPDYLSNDIMEPVMHEWQNMLFDDHNNKILSSTYYYIPADEWIAGGTTYYYYTSLGISSVSDATKNGISVYPNPFHETIRFNGIQELIHFTLFDLQGRVVFQKQVSGISEFNTGHLPSGMYVYQIDGPNGRQIGKLVRD